MPLLIPPRPATLAPSKAALGSGIVSWDLGRNITPLQRTPQKLAAQAMALYRSNDWVRLAERTVSGLAGSLDWHLEDDADKEVDAQAPAPLLAVRDLLEKPQAALDPRYRQAGIQTFRGLTTVTYRHMGIVGTGFWYLDSINALGGTPLAILYVRPDRMFATEDKAGNLLGWTLDKPMEEGGTPLTLEEILPFYLEPPDGGHFGVGLVESAWLKASIGPLLDRHVAGTIASGGRLAGMLIQKDVGTTTPDQWAQFVRDFRGIVEDPNAAKRLQILQVPAEYVRTSANFDELQITDLVVRTKEDVLALWGVPPTQAAVPAPAGLNSGDSKVHDQEILMANAVRPRLRAFWETVQYGLLDRYKAQGISVELVIPAMEPTSDEAPRYELLSKAGAAPLTGAELRAIIGMEPLEGEDPLNTAVFLNDGRSQVGGPDFVKSEPPPVFDPNPLPVALPDAATPPGKASPLARLRRQIDEREVPAVRRSVSEVLEGQRERIVGWLRRVGLDHLNRKRDFGWWNAEKADADLMKALEPHVAKIAQSVSDRTHKVLRPAKATDFAERVTERVLTRGAGRVTNINRTTRDAVQQALSVALEEAGTIDDVIRAVEELDIFGPDRSEVIARTESALAYNDAALGSYAEMGVTEVEAIDGDEDEECAERNGQVFSIEEAAGITDHPNGTLDWVPIVPDEEPEAKAAPVSVSIVNPQPVPPQALAVDRDEHGRITLIRPVDHASYLFGQVTDAIKATIREPAPVNIDVHQPEAPVVNVTVEAPKSSRRRVVRDEAGRIIEVIEEPA